MKFSNFYVIVFLFFICFCFDILSTEAAENSTHQYVLLDCEQIPIGQLSSFSFPEGKLTAQPDNAEIWVHTKNYNTKMLRILGGTDKKVHIEFNKPVIANQLALYVERWTSQLPFLFKVEIKTDSDWQEVLSLDNTYKVGIQPFISIDLKKTQQVSEIRFTSSASDQGGVLINNLCLNSGNVIPIDFKAYRLKTYTTPILIGEKGTLVERFCFSLLGHANPIQMNSIIKVQLNGAEQLQSAVVIVNQKSYPIPLVNGVSSIQIDQSTNQGQQEIDLRLEPKKNAKLNSIVQGGITEIQFQNVSAIFDTPKQSWSIARLLVTPNQNGVHTYRIPGIAKTTKGTLLVVYDCRYNSSSDLPADIDIGLSRSTDGGETWEEPRVILDYGKRDPKEGVGDPSILVDPQTGRIWVAAVWTHEGGVVSEKGLKSGKTGQFVLCYSDDDGITWSPGRNITHEIGASEDWRLVMQGPGAGICTKKGVLVFPAYFFDANGVRYSTIMSSEDHGKTWQVGTGARKQTDESQVVELSDGSLMLNMRTYNLNSGTRAVAVTKDYGKTWTEHPTSLSALPEPVCQASIFSLAGTGKGTNDNLLVFFNPCDSSSRINMTLQVSEDDGMTWTKKRKLYEPYSYGYSSLCLIDNDTIGVVYETTGGLIFQKVNISDLISSK
ncbi:MAG: glycoside hydrolase [Planctomycetaceae bacterium]|jgi:sialidase-1|nr:glycoside hydrolase [Planctomycetaceae bacterium]